MADYGFWVVELIALQQAYFIHCLLESILHGRHHLPYYLLVIRMVVILWLGMDLYGLLVVL